MSLQSVCRCVPTAPPTGLMTHYNFRRSQVFRHVLHLAGLVGALLMSSALHQGLFLVLAEETCERCGCRCVFGAGGAAARSETGAFDAQ